MANGAFGLDEGLIGSILPSRAAAGAGLQRDSLGPGLMTPQGPANMSPMPQTGTVGSDLSGQMSGFPGISPVPQSGQMSEAMQSMAPPPPTPAQETIGSRFKQAFADFGTATPEAEAMERAMPEEFSTGETFRAGGLLGLAFGLSPKQENYLRTNKAAAQKYQDDLMIRDLNNQAVTAWQEGDMSRFQNISDELRIRTRGEYDPARLQQGAALGAATSKIATEALNSPTTKQRIKDGLFVRSANPQTLFVDFIMDPLMKGGKDGTGEGFNPITIKQIDRGDEYGNSVASIVSSPDMDENAKKKAINVIGSKYEEGSILVLSEMRIRAPDEYRGLFQKYGAVAGMTGIDDPDGPSKLAAYDRDDMMRKAMLGVPEGAGIWGEFKSLAKRGVKGIGSALAGPKRAENEADVEKRWNRIKGR